MIKISFRMIKLSKHLLWVSFNFTLNLQLNSLKCSITKKMMTTAPGSFVKQNKTKGVIWCCSNERRKIIRHMSIIIHINGMA
uniref:Uncharacterized protein n=1 Tax=Anguilla anguilla TaxID=7936 RepID=A0A0E9TDA3_ANGAN